MKIVFLVKGFPRLSETFILHELLELRRQGMELRLVSVLQPEDQLVHPAAAPLCAEVTYLRTATWRQRGRALYGCLRRNPRGVGRALIWLLRQHSAAAVRRLTDALVLAQLCHDEGIGHVHAHFATVPTTIAYLVKKIAELPYSFSAHAKDVYTMDPTALRLRVEHASAVVTCTQANLRYFQDDLGVPTGTVTALRHGLPTTQFMGLNRSPVPGRLLTVGRLVPKKGYDIVARAMAELVSQGHDLTWHIAGSGPEKASLRELLTDLGLTERVRLLGSVTSEQVLDELAHAHVFTLASRVLDDGDRDGIPNVLLEAMLAGVPIVATAVSGIPEVITDGVTGRLVPPQDVSALAAGLAACLTSANAQVMAAAASAWAWENCDLQRSVEPLAALLREVTGQPAPVPA